MAQKPGMAVKIAIGKPKPGADLGSPSDFGASPSRSPRAAPYASESPDDALDTGDGSTDNTASGEVTITLSQEQATALADVLQQIQDGLGSQDQDQGDDYDTGGMDDTGAELPPAGPMRGRGGYGS
jgi:hypothetical protein